MRTVLCPMNGTHCIKMLTLSIPDDKWSRCLSTSYTDENTERVCATILNELPTHCEHISHCFAHDGFQNKSQRYEHNLTICPGLLDSYYHKGEVLRTHRRGLTTTSHKVNAIARKENIQHYQSKEVQYAATSRKNDADTYRTLKHQSWNTIYGGVQQSTMSITERCSGTG
jgi:hypothetical protein